MHTECLALLKPVPRRCISHATGPSQILPSPAEQGQSRRHACMILQDTALAEELFARIAPFVLVYIYTHIDIIYIHIKCRCMMLHDMSIPEISPI